MTHLNPAPRGSAAAESTTRDRFRPAALAAVALLSALTAWIAAPFSASAGSSPVAAAGSKPQTLDVISKVTSFSPLPSDGFIATANLFDKTTGEQVGSDVFYCLEVGGVPPSGSQTLGECPGTASFIGKGTVSVLGSFLVPPTPGQTWTVAVTGGTGRYKNVRGELKVIQISPTEEEGIFTLLG